MLSPFRPRAARAPAAERLGDVLAEVRCIELRRSRLVTDVLSGGYRSTFRGLGVEFSEVREYVEGDDPRAVDWNVTARVGRPFVKRFVEERERTLVFVCDVGPAMHRGLGAYSPRQAAHRYAALLGRMAIDNHDRVGLCAGGRGRQRFVLPQPGGGHVLRLLHGLCAEPATAAPGLPGLLDTVGARVRRRAVVMVMSDFLTAGYEAALRRCASRHDVVAVRLWPRELVDPPRVLARLTGPDGAARLCDFRDERFRRSFAAAAATERQRFQDALGHAGADRIDVEIPAERDPRALCEPLLQFFRRREGAR